MLNKLEIKLYKDDDYYYIPLFQDTETEIIFYLFIKDEKIDLNRDDGDWYDNLVVEMSELKNKEQVIKYIYSDDFIKELKRGL